MRRKRVFITKKGEFSDALKALLWGSITGIILSVDFSQSALSAADQNLSGYFHSFGTPNMIMPLFLAALLFLACEKWKKHSRRLNCCLGIVSGLFGIANALGQQMYYTDHLPNSLLSAVIMWLYAGSGALIFFAAATILVSVFPLAFSEDRSIQEKKRRNQFRLLASCIILLGWLPWIIAYYPCSADWDVYYPITQYLGMADKSNHHPWFYCTTVGSFYSLGVSISNKNLGMFLYVAIRAVIMAIVYSHLAVRIREHGYRPFVPWAIVLFFAIVPVWGAYSKHAFKDTLCAALFCWYVIETAGVVQCLRKGERGSRTFIFYSLSALMVSLYRNNCVYVAVLVTALLMIVTCIKEKTGKARAISCAILSLGMIVYGGYRLYISEVEHVENASVKEALAIPFQQTARTIRDHKNQITEEEWAGFRSIFDNPEQLGERYDPLISDPIKGIAYWEPEKGAVYLKTWLSMMFRFKRAYAESAIAQSYGYYAFTPDQALHAGNWNCGMTIFDWVKDPRFENEFTCDYIDGLARVRMFLTAWADTWHQLPFLGLSDLKAIYTWFAVLSAVLMIWKKRWMETIPAVAILLMVLTCCASPVNDCFRYYAPAAAATPALLLLFRDKKELAEKETAVVTG